MDANEQKARELLAAEYMASGEPEHIAGMEAESPHNAPAIRAIAKLLAQQVPADGECSPEGRFEQYVAAGIARSPDALRELGEYLTSVLDEDEWPTADRLLLQLATATPQAPQPVVDGSYMGMRIVEDKSLAPDEFSIRSQPQQGAVEPIGWVFQHDDTGLMAFCANDGINTVPTFQRLNPRHKLCGPAYTSPTIGQQAVDKVIAAAREVALHVGGEGIFERGKLAALTAALAAHGKGG